MKTSPHKVARPKIGAEIHPKGSGNGHSKNGDSSFLKKIREQKHLSQRAFARLLGMTQTEVVRLEKKSLPDFSYGELEFLARILGYDFGQFLVGLNGFGQTSFIRSSLKDPCLEVRPKHGVLFVSHLKEPEDNFIGELILEPAQSLLATDTPKGNLVFFRVLEGNLLVRLPAKEHLIKEGESITLKRPLVYDLHNSHPVKRMISIVVCSPSFIRAASVIANFK